MPGIATIERFPGLDLRADPGDSPGALDAYNVVIENGRVRTREGTNIRYNIANPAFLAWYPRLAAVNQIVVAGRDIAGVNTKLHAITPAGVLVASTSCPCDGGGLSSVVLGTPAATYMYLSYLGGARRWDGAAWTTPGGTFPAASLCLGLSPTDNRLAVAVTNGKLWFSDAGDPTTFGTNNFVQLNPGDGEEIRGMAVFNNQLFVFKRTKFFVFYGNSIDATGNPVFNYRTVNTGTGMHYTAGQSVCSSRSGVYFIGDDGIYVTTGGPPVKISPTLQPFFDGGAGGSGSTVPYTPMPFELADFWTPLATSSNNWGRIYAASDKVYVSLPIGVAGSQSVTLVYDVPSKTWTYWDLDAGAFVSAEYSNSTLDSRRLYIAEYNAGSVTVMDSSFVADRMVGGVGGTAIVSRYRMPFENYGSPNEKIMRDIILEGRGTPSVRRASDYGLLGTANPVAMTTQTSISAPTSFGRARDRRGTRGRWFSWSLVATSGAWELLRADVVIMDGRRSSMVAL